MNTVFPAVFSSQLSSVSEVPDTPEKTIARRDSGRNMVLRRFTESDNGNSLVSLLRGN